MRRINSIVAKNQPHRLGLNFGDPLRNKKNIIVSNVSRSLKVVGNGGIQLAIYDFLLVSRFVSEPTRVGGQIHSNPMNLIWLLVCRLWGSQILSKSISRVLYSVRL